MHYNIALCNFFRKVMRYITFALLFLPWADNNKCYFWANYTPKVK